MELERIKDILKKINDVKIAVLGDFCLDAYWFLDPRGSEVSVETGLQADAVTKHYYSLGGASNIVANIAALKPSHIRAIGVIGDDIFGRELRRQIQALNVDTTGLVIQDKDFYTVTFCKRHLEGNEQSRIDFGFFNQRTKATDKILIDSFKHALETTDVIIINQQVPGSITNESFIHKINDVLKKNQDKIVLLDSRHYGKRFRNVYRKTNQVEAAQTFNIDVSSGDVLSLSDIRRFANTLYQQDRKPVFVTRGNRGMLVVDSDGTYEISGIQILKKCDPVGAGDTTVSALACCLAAGAKPAEAAEIANLAASVTVRKLFVTGTASREEILEIAKDVDYIYQPELAEDIRQASYFKKSHLEICVKRPKSVVSKITHAVFDHDGTISCLREGWEAVMEPVMLKAVLGDAFDSANETLYHKVRNRVHDFIDKSTGIQTILQMEGLIDIIKEFGIVPPDKVLDKFRYKGIYNDALMKVVNQRIDKLNRGELDVSDYAIKGSVSFLKYLYQRGIILYLASGTDEADVINEARAMGYAELFTGGIYGALGDISKYSKKMVIERILRDNKLQGPALAVFGDGPVELRESRKHNGIAIGIAGDEIRRHGLNPEKRTRLVKAGAHIIIPDFSQPEALINYLFESK